MASAHSQRKPRFLFVANPDAEGSDSSGSDDDRQRPFGQRYTPYTLSPITPVYTENLAPSSIHTRSPVIKTTNESPLSASSSSTSPAEDTTPSPSTPSLVQPPANPNVADGRVEGLGLYDANREFYDRIPQREYPKHSRRPSENQRSASSPILPPLESRESPTAQLSMSNRSRAPLDRVFIMATTDGDLHAKVDISGAWDAAFIRERIFSKLQIPDTEQPFFAIYQSRLDDVVGSAGTALTDDELFRVCRQFGDTQGNLKFLVARSSTGVPVDHRFIPPVPAANSTLQYNTQGSSRPRVSPQSRDDSVSSSSERHSGAENVSGYQASDEEARSRIIHVPHTGRRAAQISPRDHSQPTEPRLVSPPPSTNRRAGYIPPHPDRPGHPLQSGLPTPPLFDPAHARRPSDSGAEREHALEQSEKYLHEREAQRQREREAQAQRDMSMGRKTPEMHSRPVRPQPELPQDAGIPMERSTSHQPRPRPEPWAPKGNSNQPYHPRPLPPTQPQPPPASSRPPLPQPQPLQSPSALQRRDAGRGVSAGAAGNPPPYNKLPVGAAVPSIPGKVPATGGQPVPAQWLSNPSNGGRSSPAQMTRGLVSTRSEGNLRKLSNPTGPSAPRPPLPPKHSIPEPRPQGYSTYNQQPDQSRHHPAPPYSQNRPPPSPTSQLPSAPFGPASFTSSPLTQTEFTSNGPSPLPPQPPPPPQPARGIMRPMPLLQGGRPPDIYPNGVPQAPFRADGYASYHRPQSSHDSQSPPSSRPPTGRELRQNSRPSSSHEPSSPRSPQIHTPQPQHEPAYPGPPPPLSGEQHHQSRKGAAPYPRDYAYINSEQAKLGNGVHPAVPANDAADGEDSEGTLKADQHSRLVDMMSRGSSGSSDATLVPTNPQTATSSGYSDTTLTNSQFEDEGEEEEEESEEEVDDFWVKPLNPKRKTRITRRFTKAPQLTLQTDSVNKVAIQPPTPSRRDTGNSQSGTPGGGRGNLGARPSSFIHRNSITWAPRPPAETVYEHIDEFFPDHDLDREVVDVSSASPTVVEQPAAPSGFANRRHKKSIRIVASERKKFLDRSSKLPPAATSNASKRYTTLWGSEVEEVTPAKAKGVIPPTIPESPNPNEKRVVKWVKGELIGKGTYGRVYLALNASTGEMLAVKQVEMPKTASDKADSRQVSVVDAIKSESDTLSQLNHPHIVQYLGFEQTEDYFNLFLEYVPGGSIGGCLRTHKKFDDNVVKSFTGQIISGLAYLHEMGILHRDLKADNILLDPSGICKISDFGISKRGDNIYDNNDALTQMQGTVFWMAPEVLYNNKQGYNAKIDVWSLGCVVLEMWAGRRPWEQEDMMAVMFKVGHLRQAPPVPDDVKLSPVADDFRLKCFAIDPAERPTAAELLSHPYLILPPGWAFTSFS